MRIVGAWWMVMELLERHREVVVDDGECDQQHDADLGTLAMADQWLKDNISPLLSSAYFSPGGNGVLFITFDNADSDAQGLVFTAVVGLKVRPGIKVSTAFRHENTLRTIMELLGLSNFPGASATAAPMHEFFK